MNPELSAEINRLQNILDVNGFDFAPNGRVSADTISAAETRIGLTFDPNVKALWEFTNGSNNETWFGVMSDELTPCAFPSFEDAVGCWSWHLPYDDATYEEWNVDDERDQRIQPKYIRHRLWFPLAENNGFSTCVLFDADPTKKGDYGQIIVYQHDPDAIYYVAQDFLSFFRKSNELLEANAKELLLGEYS